MLKYGGAKALTKHDDLLKCRIDETFDEAKIEITPQLIDNTLHRCTPECDLFDSEIQTVVTLDDCLSKSKMTNRAQLEKAAHYLYDLENCDRTEKVLNMDLGLYQMEDY